VDGIYFMADKDMEKTIQIKINRRLSHNEYVRLVGILEKTEESKPNYGTLRISDIERVSGEGARPSYSGITILYTDHDEVDKKVKRNSLRTLMDFLC
jgi:hypothetical protein